MPNQRNTAVQAITLEGELRFPDALVSVESRIYQGEIREGFFGNSAKPEEGIGARRKSHRRLGGRGARI